MRYKMPEGCKAYYTHHRYKNPMSMMLHGREITPIGWTRCRIVDQSNTVVSSAIAFCRNTDQYNKSIGRAISLGRALKAWHE